MAERDPNTEAREVETELRFRASRTNAIGQADPPLTGYTLTSMADTLGASLDASAAALKQAGWALEQASRERDEMRRFWLEAKEARFEEELAHRQTQEEAEAMAGALEQEREKVRKLERIERTAREAADSLWSSDTLRWLRLVLDDFASSPGEPAEKPLLDVDVDCNVFPAAETETDCVSCGEGNPANECPASRRPCGHHCNHSWSHGRCGWCGEEFGEVAAETETNG